MDWFRVWLDRVATPGRPVVLMLATPIGGPEDAFLVPSAGEFAHVHPGQDGSMHLALPPALAADVVAKGWGVAHPLAGVRLTPGMVMLFGPRDDAELEIVVGVAATAYAWARGASDRANTDKIPAARSRAEL